MSIPTAPPSLPSGRDVDDRGETVLARRVLEKTASQVARDETFAGGSSGGFLGIGSRADLSARPDASVELAGNVASLKVTVGLPYPMPLRQTTEQLRRRITERVTELTGVQVRQVDITVSWLKPPQRDPRGRRKLQ
ncbi:MULTISPECIES: Asp23/Gls24 family envelope stress response protein [Arthrobacter]|uniref:Alkaline shock response membrane anchor protein AmaP n=1 Tax=Arthrobacter jinronghuae TaxID=2964609 RepID=A0ABT1NPK3_9MICC|nr:MULTISPECIES: alkaline shock response membrane anchor protein AmaP [Arthrobacter]MCQ1948674.1 alkaline shock response membrane anchor protein AmaP [Arthrobacter jinronghuae]MCQ1952000.1 alkaline shock response membrane anchor protein AmaP [Arthrobacter sp. zg-Y238]MCQ1955864.1 alkaline shock response membrane anchor protein AmaP [Arthrobacter jinronghuae]UWX78513.1 alkaline shock response membrane anchor protein AmaP [Arthrobacter jinronghuae]